MCPSAALQPVRHKAPVSTPSTDSQARPPSWECQLSYCAGLSLLLPHTLHWWGQRKSSSSATPGSRVTPAGSKNNVLQGSEGSALLLRQLLTVQRRLCLSLHQKPNTNCTSQTQTHSASVRNHTLNDSVSLGCHALC